MKEYFSIELTQGRIALVSGEDFEGLSKHNWNVAATACGNKLYATRTVRNGAKKSTVYMHRQIMGNPPNKHIDHANGNTLDNRRENLRVVNRSQNMWNSKTRSHNESGLKGAHFNKIQNIWSSSIRVYGKLIYLGRFETAAEAHEAYCRASAKYHGEYARTA